MPSPIIWSNHRNKAFIGAIYPVIDMKMYDNQHSPINLPEIAP